MCRTRAPGRCCRTCSAARSRPPSTCSHRRCPISGRACCAGAARSPFLPDTPTFAEAGYPKIVIAEWQGIFVPAQTPPAIVEALNRSVRDALHTNAVQSGLTSQSFEVSDLSAQEFAARVKSDFARWGAIAKENGFTAAD